VSLLLHDDHNVAGLLTRILVSLSVESVLAIVRRSLVNVCVEDLLLFGDFLSIASAALVGFINDFTLASAIFARSLGLGVHARAQLSHLGDHATSATGATLLHSAIFAALSVALGADTFSVHRNLGRLSIVNLLKGHL